MSKDKVEWVGIWRSVASRDPNGNTWILLPGIYPAGGDEPSDDPNVIAAALAKRAQIKAAGATTEIEVRLFRADTQNVVRLDVVPSTAYIPRNSLQ